MPKLAKAACKSATRPSKSVLSRVALVGRLTTPCAKMASLAKAPVCTWMPNDTGAVVTPLANSAKPSATISCVQAGVETVKSPSALKRTSLFSRKVVKRTLPPKTTPSSNSGCCTVAGVWPVPPRTSMSLPATRPLPKVTCPLAWTVMVESPSK